MKMFTNDFLQSQQLAVRVAVLIEPLLKLISDFLVADKTKFISSRRLESGQIILAVLTTL